MQIAVIGTYPPTRCGIATFTADVERALTDAGVTVSVIVVDPDRTQRAGRVPTIVSNDRASYAAVAEWLNSSDLDLVLVQHEFGIHGGADGSHLLELTEHLRLPYVVTLHTVLTRFSATQSAILESLCRRAAGITVFTATARQMIIEQELATSAAITIVPHGAPIELYQPVGRSLHHELGLRDGAPVLSTFGLLSPGKGIEIAISALREIVDEVPEVRYVVAGRTHPGVQRSGGERYRSDLQRLTEALRLEDHVQFVDRFLTVEEIAELLSITRVFLTPYRNADQIVSGVLTFAIAAGCPVVTTPYRYGCDMVADGAGLIVPFNDPDALARATLTLLRDGEPRARALEVAGAVSATLSWPAVGRTLEHVLADAVARTRPIVIHVPTAAPSSAHLLALLDDTSVMQHAVYRLPRLEEGYCVDDAARLLPIAARLAEEDDIGYRWSSGTVRMLAFLRAAGRDGDGLLRNFMSWDRRWLDEPHDGDHVARSLWGLGELLQQGRYINEVTPLFQQLIDRPITLPHSRLVAYRTLGLLAAGGLVDTTAALTDAYQLVQTWQPDLAEPGWHWPEDHVAYDAARLPEVMLRLGARVGDETLVERGQACLSWLERRCREGAHYRFPGHLGLRPGEALCDTGDEQPLEAAAMIDAAVACFDATGDPWALDVAERAWGWFLGNNRLGWPLGSLATGACHDALTAHGVNQNCGAESTIAFHRAADAIGLLRRRAEGAGACSSETISTR